MLNNSGREVLFVLKSVQIHTMSNSLFSTMVSLIRERERECFI